MIILKWIRIMAVLIVIFALVRVVLWNSIKLQSTTFFRKYTADDLSYFSEVGFGYGRVQKWNTAIQVQIIPPYRKADSIEIETIMNESRPLIGKTDILLVKENGNLLIHFPQTAKEFNSHRSWTDSRPEPKGFTSPDFDMFGNPKKADIYVIPYLNGKGKWETLRHEFCHALGLWGDSKMVFHEPHLLGITSYTNFDTYEKDLDLPSFLPEADQRALKLLYEDSLPQGLSKSKFVEAVEKLKN